MTSSRSSKKAGKNALPLERVEAFASKAEDAEDFLKAIANAHRLKILCELNGREVCVTDLQKALGVGQSSISQHLARLRQQSIVQARRESQTIYYSLADDRSQRMISLLCEIFGRD